MHKEIMNNVLIGVFIISAIIALSFFALYHYGFFAPKFENARRSVFESTRSYNQAKIQELAKYRLEYLKVDENGKAAIAATIMHRFADYDDKRLPSELRNFLEKTRGY
jgi:hypothetical protein